MNDPGSLPAAALRPRPGWRRARLGLIGLLAVVTLTGGFYTVENWRGKRAWDKCRKQLEARGATYDWNSRIPPQVPDDENFFKAPRMAEWFAGRGETDLSRRLTATNREITSSVASTSNLIATAESARSYLAWSDQFAPDFELVRTALKRPYARIDCDYSRPTTVLAPNFLSMRSLVQVLGQRTRCHLLLGEPEKALAEMTLIHDSCRLLEGAPTGKPMTLVAAMINVAVRGLYADLIADGLRMHAWQDPQLRELIQQSGEVRIGRWLEETFQDEPMFSLRTLESSTRTELIRLCPDNTGATGGTRKSPSRMLKYAPRGWLYQNMVVHADLVQHYADGFDSENQTVSPESINKAFRAAQLKVDQNTPYAFLTYWFMPNYLKACQRYARNLTAINEAAAACALERYRLAHGEYPPTLETLVPQFIAKTPKDPIRGGALKYRRADDGAFVLHSVGWNEKDDGGTVGKTLEDGDWVWLSVLNP